LNKGKIVPILEVLFTVIVWGASFIATKVALRDLSPVTLVWMRFGIGVVILGIATAVRRQFAFPARNELGYLALLGFLGITSTNGCNLPGCRQRRPLQPAGLSPVFPYSWHCSVGDFSKRG